MCTLTSMKLLAVKKSRMATNDMPQTKLYLHSGKLSELLSLPSSTFSSVVYTEYSTGHNWSCVRQSLTRTKKLSVYSKRSQLQTIVVENRHLFSLLSLSIPTPTMSVGVGRVFGVFCCLSVCLSVCLSAVRYNSKTNDPKVFKLGIGNDRATSQK